MATVISEKSINEKIERNFSLLTSMEVILFIEDKIKQIIEEDKKLEKPVFLFIDKDIIFKLAHFLAGYLNRPIAIGIAGQSASGKSTIAQDIIDSIVKFQENNSLPDLITRINTDDYYYDRSEMVKEAGSFAEFAKNYDLDVPGAFELDLLKRHIKLLLAGKEAWLPKYDMSGTAKRYDEHTLAIPNKLIITEGLYCLSNKVNDTFDFSIFVDVSPEAQKERWFTRAQNRNITGDSAQKVFDNVISKAKVYVKPTSHNADVIVNGEAERSDYKDVVNKFLSIVELLMLEKLI